MELRDLRTLVAVVRTGSFTTAAAELAAALRRLRRSQPALRATVRATDPATALADLASGRADLALVDGVGAPDNPLALAEPGLFETTALAEDPLVVALPRGHPLAGRSGIDLTMLADAPWVAAPRLPPSAGLSLPQGQVVCQDADLLGTLAFVAADHGCVLLPASVPVSLPGVSFVPLREPRLVQRVEMMTRRDPAGPAAKLVDELRRHARLS